MTSKKTLRTMLELAEANQDTTQRGWDIASEALKKQNKRVSELNEENRKLKECVTKYRNLAEFNRANAGPAEYLVAHVNDEWVVLAARQLIGYGRTALDAESYVEYGKFPGFREARDVATLLNESSERKDNN